MNQPHLRSFRLVCKPEHAALVEDLLNAQGFVFAKEPFSPLARRLVLEPFPIGSSIAARLGYIYVQDRSSMLPPLLLAPPPGAAVLDICASPGSKTGFLGQMTGNTGFVLANEPTKSRLGTLRRNLQHLNLLCCATTSHSGERIPLPGPGEALSDSGPACAGWNFILLDPPCSGWGTVEKHPQAMRLWQGDKVTPLIRLQQRLLAEAARLLAPGGLLCYSTCTTNVAENEEQVGYALQKLDLCLAPAPQPPGFAFAEPALGNMPGVLRVPTGPDGQGFFVALLQKKPADAVPGPGSDAAAQAAKPRTDGLEPFAPEASAITDGGFFTRPWERESRFVGERRRHNSKQRDNRAGPVLLDRCRLDGPLLESAVLGGGDLAIYSDVIHFLPTVRQGLVPERFAWKGHVIGRMGRGGEARASAHLRALMPAAADAVKNGATIINLEDKAPLIDLLNGQGLAVDGKAREIGLYFKALPLCRLQVKGRRAVLPPLGQP